MSVGSWLRDLAADLGAEGYLEGCAERLEVTAHLLEDELAGEAPRGCLVDLGAFPGFLSLLARERLGFEEVDALTLAWSDAFEDTMARHGVRVHQADLEVGPAQLPDGCADAVLFCEVLEHLLYPHEVVREVARLVRPGGLVVASSPNLASLRCRTRLLAGLPILDPLPEKPPPEAGPGAGVRPHVRLYLPGEATTLFAAHGLEPVAWRWCEHTGHRPGLGAGLRRGLRRAVTGLLPRLKDTWVVALRRRRG